LVAILGAVMLIAGIVERDWKEALSGVGGFGIAAFAYFIYISRWKR
jgi:hypothetical protein